MNDWKEPYQDDDEERDARIAAAREQAEAARAIRRAEGRRTLGDLTSDGYSAVKDKVNQAASDAAMTARRAASAEGVARGAAGVAKGVGKVGRSTAGYMYQLSGSPASSAQGLSINVFFYLTLLANFMILGIGMFSQTMIMYLFLAVLGWFMVFKGDQGLLSKQSLTGLGMSFGLAAAAFFWPIILSKLWFLNDRTARIIAVTLPVYAIYFLSNPSTPHLQRIQKIYVIIFAVIAVSFASTAMAHGNLNIPGLPNVTYDVRSGLLDLWDLIWESIQVLIHQLQRISALGYYFVIGRIDYATGGQLTAGRVDPNAVADLGVRFDKMEMTQREFYDDESVSVYAVISADTLDEPIRMNVRCIANYDKNPSPDAKNKNIHADSIIPSYLLIDQRDSRDIDCIYNPGSLPIGSNSLSVFVDYSFVTTATQKAYFVDEERARALQRNDIDILAEYGITDTAPVAIHTQGPVMIGLGFRKLPVHLSRGLNDPSTLDISIQNRWQGTIMGITSLVIKIPYTMAISESMCSNYRFTATREGDFNVYTLQDPPQLREFEPFKTFRCPIEFNDIEGILGSGPVATRFFHVETRYKYQMEKKTSVRVLNSSLHKLS